MPFRTRGGFLLMVVLAWGGAFLRAEDAGSLAAAARPRVEWFGPAWLEPYDPTLLSRRVLSEFEYQDLENGESRGKLQGNLRYAALLTDDVALGFLANVPFAWAKSGGRTETGLGDVELRLGVLGRFSSVWRGGLALNVKLPTARDSVLGDGVTELRSIAAIRWDATGKINLGVNAEYSFTPRDEGSASVSALELKFPATFEFGERWSAFTSYNPRWNFRDGDALRHRMELGLTRVFGASDQYALSAGVEIPLTPSNETIDWKCNVGLTWHFE